MSTKTIDELKEGGYSEGEIADMLEITLMDVYNHLSGVKEHIPQVCDLGDESDTDTFKKNVLSTASEAVTQLKSNIRGNKDAVEVSKMTDSLAKMYTAFFKEDKGTQITVMNNNLSMFKDSLKR